MTIRSLLTVAIGAIAALALAGCVPNSQPGDALLTVSIGDELCQVSATTAAAGKVTFALTNDGSDVNEFEILADDQLRIVGEKESVVPGQTVNYTVQLDPGTYYTACRFQMVGAPIGLAEFTVTGDSAPVDADGSAIFAIPPGARQGRSVGDALFG